MPWPAMAHAIDSLGSASMSAERMTRMDPSMESFVETINQALIAAQDALAAIRDYRDEVEANPARLEQIEERLDAIRQLKRKYGDTIDEIIHYGEKLAGKIDDLVNAESRSHELTGRIDDLRGIRVRLVRTDRMKEIRAGVRERRRGRTRGPGDGQDQVRGQHHPNRARAKRRRRSRVPDLAEPRRARQASCEDRSGGEMSRIMLALKSVRWPPQVPTLVLTR